MNVKKVMIIKRDGGLVSLSLQSETIEPKGMRIKATEHILGEPTSMHKIDIGLLTEDDLDMIVEAIEDYMEEKMP